MLACDAYGLFGIGYREGITQCGRSLSLCYAVEFYLQRVLESGKMILPPTTH